MGVKRGVPLKLALATLIVVGVFAAGQSPASALTDRQALDQLVVAEESRAGYDRGLFNHWVDADQDGCDTRDEVLLSEAVRRPNVRSNCRLGRGLWVSEYDGKRVKNPSKLDVDHVVPLAEAWDSGASRWDADTRQRFANDLGSKDSLIAVSASSNRSKGDRDPAEWMPRKTYQCNYARDWVAIKYRWGLSVDAREKQALQRVLRSCRPGTLEKQREEIFQDDEREEPDFSSTAPTEPTTESEGSSGQAARYFRNCTLARGAGVTPIYAGSALYNANTHLDRDKDGVACE